MIDIHHHLLHGLDDGSPDLRTSLEMARMAVSDGITHVVCTPHSSADFEYQPEAVAERAAELRSALQQASIPLTLGIGCDFHLSYDNIRAALAAPTRYSVNQGPYLLVELPDFGLSPTLVDTFYQMQLAGITPILTHPERNSTLQKDNERLAEWLRAGILVQVTAASVVGKMGKAAERMSHQLLANRWVHFIATDAHNVTTRPPLLREAASVVDRRYGQAYARRLVEENPRAVFECKPLGPQDEPLKLYDAELLHEIDDEIPRVPWWKRWFGKKPPAAE